jgi:hypothetical protein
MPLTIAAKRSRLLLQILADADRILGEDSGYVSPREPQRISIDPFYAAAADLLKSLGEMPVPRIPVDPEPGDFQEISLHFLDLAFHVDRYILAIGEELRRKSPPGTVDMSCFSRVLSNAIEGRATYECERAAQALREWRS